MVHGTPSGYDAGCRGGECANHRTDRMTCTDAHNRYQWDGHYRAAVLAGTATDEREMFVVKVARVIRESPEAAKKRAAGPKRVAVGTPRPYQKKPIVHGTRRGADELGCKADCPNEFDGGISCIDARRAVMRANHVTRQAALEAARPADWKRASTPGHGIPYGATRCTEDCPSEAAGGISCQDAYTAARKRNNARRVSRAKVKAAA